MRTRADFVLDREFLSGLDTHLVPPAGVAIVGAGRWARVICGVLTRFTPPMPRITLVAQRNYDAACEWVAARAREDERFRTVSVSPSLRDLLDDGGAPVAFVTRMAAEHYPAARELLMAGAHVLVEKPFVLEPVQAEDLVRLARQQNRTIAVGYEYMFARTFHHFRETIARHAGEVTAVRIVWDDCPGIEKWGIRKEPDLSANVVTDLYPHVLSQLLVLFGKQEIALRGVTSADGYRQAQIDLAYGDTPVTVRVDKNAARPLRTIAVLGDGSGAGTIALDYTVEPGAIEIDGQAMPPDPLADAFPSSLTSEIAYFFAHTTRCSVNIPNSAVDTMHVVDATDRANTQLAARQAQEVRPLLWSDLPAEVPDGVMAILRHHLLPPLLRYGLVTNPKDTAALDEQVTRAFRIAHRFSRDPWAGQQRLMQEEGLTTDRVLALNGAIRESDFMQDLIVRQGVAKKYWSTILPLVETGSVEAVLNNTYQFPVRLGIYAAVYCMFSCSFCGRMKNPGARYSYDDVEPGNGLFDAIFSAMPRGISTLSLGGGLEPLTNTKIDDVVHSAKRYGHKVPLVTNAFMLTPAYVRRHPGLWDVDVLRVSLYGVDEPSYLAVTNKPGAFPVVKNNVIEFLRERRRRGGGPRFGFNFIVLVDSTDQVLRVLDLICEINEAVGAPAVDFLTLREDFSIAEGEGLTPEERRDLVAIFREFNQRRRRECPELNVDFGYALYPLSEGVEWPGLAMVAHQGMLPKAYPQVSVALDLLGDVYLYRDAAFPERPCSDRYMIGTITKDRPLETVVAEFIESGREIPAHPDDPGLMDAFDHVVTKLIWQLQGDRQAGVPFGFGPVRYGTRARAAGAGPAVNYWQNLFGA